MSKQVEHSSEIIAKAAQNWEISQTFLLRPGQWKDWHSRYLSETSEELIQEAGRMWWKLSCHQQDQTISLAFRYKKYAHIGLLSQYVGLPVSTLLQRLYQSDPSQLIRIILYHLAEMRPDQITNYFKDLKETGVDILFPDIPDLDHPVYYLLEGPDVIKDMVRNHLWDRDTPVFGVPPKPLTTFIGLHAPSKGVEIWGDLWDTTTG